MSLAPKLDEVSDAIANANLDIACITETLLRDHIHDNVISIPGCNLVRRDRIDVIHGGVCTYIKKGLKYTVLEDLYDDKIEVIWLQLRPSRLPRGLSCIIIANVYHPQTDKGVSDPEILHYLYDSRSSIESCFSNCEVLITGDFNRLDISRFRNAFKLTQTVKFHTRGNQTLDLVLTNIKEFYGEPIKRPAFGLSDHASVEIQPLSRCKTQPSKRPIITRDQRESYRVEKGIISGMDAIMPLKETSVSANEAPWMNNSLKRLIRRRQKALTNNNLAEYNQLRIKVNRVRKARREKYYDAKVKDLKACKPAQWWKEIKQLSGFSKVDRASPIADLQHLADEREDPKHLANVINDAFLSPMSAFTPLATPDVHAHAHAHAYIHQQEPPRPLSEFSVFKKLSTLNTNKASGPDRIPSWVLKENADLLAAPVADILNSSFLERRLPTSWKKADITPLPKTSPVSDANKHLRLISLTPILSKVGEEFVVDGYVKPAVLAKIDRNQYGSVPKSSTVHALISMLHNWYKDTDGNGSTMRVMLFDFKKAFDLIDHAILMAKLGDYELPPWVLDWIADFLTDRKQRVKLAHDCHSDWGSVRAGVPQETKLGP